MSDPDGMLQITSAQALLTVKQGSNQASFLECPCCHDVLCTSYDFGNNLKGAVNTNLLDDTLVIGKSEISSPKHLSAQQKISRWNKLWMKTSIIIEQLT
jgi:hypothetical protein